MSNTSLNSFITPFESGNANQTTTWHECISFYEKLAAEFPHILRFWQIGVSDNGVPMHAGLVSSDGVFELARIHASGRPIFFNNNGIHPGEPEGIDACMALVRDFCTQPQRLAALDQTVFLFIPVYNVDGCLNRQNTSRVNQLGPERFGFRANGRHLDLNRDFIKCDSLAAQTFNRFFSEWQPDVMVDTHTSNGADYQYTMTLIPTQPDKLGGELGAFLRQEMLPAIYEQMEERGWPTCPYVNPIKQTPDDGIEDFLEVPRFSTGYAALHHSIGFMPETHMLKPFADRYAAMRHLVEVVLAFTIKHGQQIKTLRRKAKSAAQTQTSWPIYWKADREHPSTFRFKGFQAVYQPSKLGNYQRLSYDRNQPWEKDIPYYNRFVPDITINTPKAYVIPQAWREVVERLQWNGLHLQRLEEEQTLEVQTYRIKSVQSRATAYEGHMFHDEVNLSRQVEQITLKKGDYLLDLSQANARYAIETLEPQAHDSFFRWGFFNSILEKKEHFSDYVFEDTALEMLETEPLLREKFSAWKQTYPELLDNQEAVLNFLYEHGLRHSEPEWGRYPIITLINNGIGV